MKANRKALDDIKQRWPSHEPYDEQQATKILRQANRLGIDYGNLAIFIRNRIERVHVPPNETNETPATLDKELVGEIKSEFKCGTGGGQRVIWSYKSFT
jgi:hypothetical protein